MKISIEEEEELKRQWEYKKPDHYYLAQIGWLIHILRKQMVMMFSKEASNWPDLDVSTFMWDFGKQATQYQERKPDRQYWGRKPVDEMTPDEIWEAKKRAASMSQVGLAMMFGLTDKAAKLEQ